MSRRITGAGTRVARAKTGGTTATAVTTGPARILPYAMFFLSGASALAYQAVWARLLGQVFGNTVYAASAVLAAFMAGLALGSALAGTHAMQRRAGLRLYAVLQAAIAIFGVLVPLVAPRLPQLYGWLARLAPDSAAALTPIRLVFSFLLLLVPCTAMGATLPTIVGALERRRAGIGRSTVALLYGINTLGSVLGCALAGFLLIGRIGLLGTSGAAAGLNAVVAFVAFAVGRRWERRTGTGPAIASKEQPVIPSDAQSAPEPALPSEARLAAATRPRRLWVPFAAVYMACGFAAMGLEVAWTRALVWTIGLDTYAFTAMLVVVLAGIGIGSALAPALGLVRRANRVLPLITAALACSVFLSLALIRTTPQALSLLVQAVNSLPALRSVFQALGAYAMVQLSIGALVIFLPALLMGASFPVFAARISELAGGHGRGTARTYAANTIGGILGSLIGGFVLVPLAGLLPAVAILGCVYMGASLALLVVVPGRKLRRPAFTWGGAAGLVAAGVVLVVTARLDFESVLAKNLRTDDSGVPIERILYYRDHATGAVVVKESEQWGREMLIDGTQVASTGSFDLHSHLYPAHLIGLLHPAPHDTLVVAFGCGGTAGSLLIYPEVRTLEAVEISEGVVEPAKRFFSEMNRGVFDDPRLKLFIQDGRNFVRLTDRRYDVVYSGPIHPQSNQGSAALYTREYFRDCSRLLKPGGFQVLWLPLHVTEPEYFKTVVRTFLSVYPHVSLWYLPQTSTSASHPHLVGSFDPLPLDYGLIRERLGRSEVLRDLDRIGDSAFSSPAEFISQRAMGTAAVRDLVSGENTLNTDNLPVVEFYRPILNPQAAKKYAKAILLNHIFHRLEDPMLEVVNVPPEERASLAADVGRFRDADSLLLEGHALLALVEFSDDLEVAAELSPRIRAAYRKARQLVPERDSAP